MTNSVDVKGLLTQAEGLLSGHFCLTSGLHSDTYFQCAKLYQYPEITEELGKRLAKALKDVEFDTIVAPAIGAMIIGYETAKQSKKRNLFVERKDGEMQLRRGYTLKKGERVVIIEDVITTARTIKETMEAIKEFEPEVVAVGCIVDRTKGQTDYNIKSLLQIDGGDFEKINLRFLSYGKILQNAGNRGNV